MRQNGLSLALLVCALLAPASAHAQEVPEAPAAGVSTKSNPWLERRVLNIAHQGGEHEAPSNTMFAYKTALAKGADVLEMDVQLTSDGHIVVFHDRTVDNRTNGSGAVNDLTLEQIRALDPADNWNQYRGIATGTTPPPDGFTADDFRIPTLREVLEQYPDQLLNIEIKGLAPDSTDPGWQDGQAEGKNQALETAVALAALLREYKRDDDVIVVSFSELALQQFKAEAPEIHTAAGLESAALFFGTSVQLAPGITNAEHVALQVPEYFEAGNGAPPIQVVTKDFVEDAHANGLAVHVWLNGHPTENDETYARLTSLGVDGIMTDQPTRLESNYRAQGIAEEEPRPFHRFDCTEQPGGGRFCQGTMNSRVRTFDGVPLDVNFALPPKPATGPDGDYPLIIQLHGWGGSKSGYSSMRSWAEAGYAVLNYTARGFGNSCGSPQSRAADPVGCARGWIKLADSRFEARDSQYLAGLLADQGLVDPQRIGSMGGSYGGGQSLHLAVLRDRVRLPSGAYAPWVSEKRELPMRIAATAPTVPWSDLVYSLMPNGRTRDYLVDDQLTSRSPAGVMKASFVSGLFAAGAASGYYAPPGADLDADLITWYARVAAGEPYDETVAQNVADEIALNHSPYHLLMDREPAPTLISNGWADDLFPVDEAVRFANKVAARQPGATIAQLHLDFGHARGVSQPKPEDDAELRKQTRAWMDRYVKGDAGVDTLEGVKALAQTCPRQGPSPTYQAASWHELHPGEVRYASSPAQTVLAASGDPQTNQRVDPISGGGSCAEVGSVPREGDAVYELPAAEGDGYTLLGSATVIADMAVQGSDAALVARLWDVSPEGPKRLVARALYRPGPVGRQVFQLHPNGWHFAAGHVPQLELVGQDAPYARPSNHPWTLTLTNLELRLPVAESPDCEQVLSPAAPFIPDETSPDNPDGPELAPGVDPEPRDLCALEDPVASFDFAPAEPKTGEAVSFTSTATDSDGTVSEQSWDLDGDGQYDDATGPTAERTFTEPGDHTVGLSVTDSDGLSATASRTVTVAAAPSDGGGDTGTGGDTGAEGDTGTGDTGTGTGGGTDTAPTTGTPLETPTESSPRQSDPTPSQAPPAGEPPEVALTAPRLASDTSRGPRVVLGLTPTGAVDHYELDYRTAGSSRFRRLTSDLAGSARRYRFDGEFGTTYEFRARAVSADGRTGAWDGARSIVPFDDFRRLPDYARDSWDLVRTRGAFGGRVTRSSQKDAEVRLRFRGTRLYLIGRRSPRGGPAIAILDGERRRIGFRSRRVRERAVIATWRLERGRHRLRVVNLGRGRVEIDGFGVDSGL